MPDVGPLLTDLAHDVTALAKLDLPVVVPVFGPGAPAVAAALEVLALTPALRVPCFGVEVSVPSLALTLMAPGLL